MFNYATILEFLLAEGINAVDARKLATYLVAATTNASLAAATIKAQWVAEDVSAYRALVARNDGSEFEVAFTAVRLTAGLMEYTVKVTGPDLQYSVNVLESSPTLVNSVPKEVEVTSELPTVEAEPEPPVEVPAEVGLDLEAEMVAAMDADIQVDTVASDELPVDAPADEVPAAEEVPAVEEEAKPKKGRKKKQ